MFENDANYLDQHFLIDEDIIKKYVSFPRSFVLIFLIALMSTGFRRLNLALFNPLFNCFSL